MNNNQFDKLTKELIKKVQVSAKHVFAILCTPLEINNFLPGHYGNETFPRAISGSSQNSLHLKGN